VDKKCLESKRDLDIDQVPITTKPVSRCSIADKPGYAQ
jgi:hypothetical protein